MYEDAHLEEIYEDRFTDRDFWDAERDVFFDDDEYERTF